MDETTDTHHEKHLMMEFRTINLMSLEVNIIFLAVKKLSSLTAKDIANLVIIVLK